MKAKVMAEGTHAVLAVDPGGTTGLACAYVELGSTLKETLLAATMKKSVEVPGSWLSQATQLKTIADRFVFTANVENRIPIPNIHFAFEDFTLRPGGGMPDLTSVWVMAPVIHHLHEADWQWAKLQASAAKGFATNDRLKMWGLYEPGSDHIKDAWRHLAARVNGILT